MNPGRRWEQKKRYLCLKLHSMKHPHTLRNPLRQTLRHSFRHAFLHFLHQLHQTLRRPLLRPLRLFIPHLRRTAALPMPFLLLLFLPLLLAPQPLAAREPGTAIVAHRGYWNCAEAGHAPNSLAALRCAQRAGFWGSEFDVNMTSDGELLVFHDSEIEGRRIDAHPASAFRHVRLANGERIPTLDRYLRQARKSAATRLVFEIKGHATPELESEAVDRAITRLKAHRLFRPERVIFISFSLHICRRIAALAPGFTVQYLGDDLTPDRLAAEGVNGIDIWFGRLLEEPGRYAAARRNAMSVNAWTVNEEADMERLFRLGVDQLTTDQPLRARETLRRLGIAELGGGVPDGGSRGQSFLP